jgi:NAD(P)-dependent dehydrogenase (short-subunit alcohol dehydrogenase family)
MSHAGDLVDKVALVTGGARGYGEAVSRRLAAAGATVVVLGRDPSRVTALATEIGGLPAIADVVDQVQVQAAVDQVLADAGRIDVLVNNAGLGWPLGPAWEVDSGEWWHCVEVNVRGSYIVTRAVLPAMIAAGSGRIINIVSHAGTARWPLGSAYAVSKAALIKLGENLAVETQRYGIAIVNYHPGILDIGLTETLLTKSEISSSESRVADWFQQQIDSGNNADVDDSCDTVVALAAGAADRLSGRYLTAYDDLGEILKAVESGNAETQTLGLIR